MINAQIVELPDKFNFGSVPSHFLFSIRILAPGGVYQCRFQKLWYTFPFEIGSITFNEVLNSQQLNIAFQTPIVSHTQFRLFNDVQYSNAGGKIYAALINPFLPPLTGMGLSLLLNDPILVATQVDFPIGQNLNFHLVFTSENLP